MGNQTQQRGNINIKYLAMLNSKQVEQIAIWLKVPEHWALKKFEHLKGEVETIVKELQKVEVDKPYRLICLAGKQNGIGKTHLAVCLFKKFIFERVTKILTERQKEDPDITVNDLKLGGLGIFAKEYQILSNVINNYEHTKSDSKAIYEYVSTPLLVIDDLFSNRTNDFARRIMLNLIDERCDWHGYPTVITTNLSLEEIGEIDSRIASRLQSDIFYLIKLQTDFRNKK